MKERLSFSQTVSAACMLFSIFFGAGNMIFPPLLGQLSGARFFAALLGFIVTDAGIAILAVVAVMAAGDSMDQLAGRVGPRFAVALTAAVYFLIGPLFALPRTGSVSFELGVAPLLPEGNAGSFWAAAVYSAVFFTLTYFLSLNPSKIVDIVGKVLTPFLLVSIAVIFFGALLHPVGQIGPATGEYADIPFFKGMIEGYLTLDGFAGLVFAITVANSLHVMGIRSKKAQLKSALSVGLISALLLTLVYGALTYVGAQASSMPAFSNGGVLLASVTRTLFGRFGSVVLGAAVILACLTTSIGLTTSFGDYFAKLCPRYSYKKIISTVCIFSFSISVVGLSALIAVVLPLLIMLYPVITVLIVASFFDRFFHGRKQVYILGISFAFAVSFFDGLRSAQIVLPVLSNLALKVPFAELGVGWVLPAVLGCLLGLIPFERLVTRK